jgi:hypothetical protein
MAIQYAYRLSLIIFMLVITHAAFHQASPAPTLMLALKMMFIAFLAGFGVAVVMQKLLDEIVIRDVNQLLTDVYSPLLNELSTPPVEIKKQ